ncbi:MAG TPA: hypothetical protein VMV15_13880 [Candidatus Binataceae bacterium]|nr:hypothetical protein [Candidatus Binataceae bacterium]
MPELRKDPVVGRWVMMATERTLTKVAGFEVGTGFYINPVPPETAAKHLRAVLNGAEPADLKQAQTG